MFSNACLCLSDSAGFLKFKTFFTLGPECFIILCSSKAAQTTLKVNLFRAVIIERMIKLHFPTLLSQYCGVSDYFHRCRDDIDILASNLISHAPSKEEFFVDFES